MEKWGAGSRKREANGVSVASFDHPGIRSLLSAGFYGDRFGDSPFFCSPLLFAFSAHCSLLTLHGPRFPLHKYAVSLMMPQLCNQEGIRFNFIDDPVLIADTPGPVARQAMLQRLRLSGSFERSALDLFCELVDAIADLSVGALPIRVICPGVLRKNEFHSANSRSVPPPASSSAIDSSSLRAFRGLRRR